jgi:beta-glucosidase
MKEWLSMERLSEILSTLTLEEKVSLCAGLDMWHLPGIERLGIPSIMLTNGPHGLQKQTGETDHIGVSDSIPATCFPPAVIQAATWNRDLVYQLGKALGEECRQEKVSVLLGPGINIKRSPLGGRNYDYYSEDPYLAGEMGKSHILGVQSQGVGTSLKHFAVSNQEYRRMTINVVVDERALREIYLAGFEKIVKDAQPWTVMSAYHVLNGAYCSENRTILSDILKEEWGFEGVIVSDWGSVNDRLLSMPAGLDLEMPGPALDNRAAILSAIDSGELDMATLDKAVTRNLALILKAQAALAEDFQYDAQAHHALARRVAEEGIVLLKNENKLLPISDNTKLALIGRMAKEPSFQGGGSSLTNATQVENLYDEMVARIGSENVLYAEGYAENDRLVPDADLIAAAAAAARDADVAVVMVGTQEGEGGDHPNMDLPASHNALIEAVAAVQNNVVVLLSNGNPVEMPWIDQVPAVVEGYLSGQAGAGAQADILIGKVNPSGKLGESFPIHLEDNPSHAFFPGGPLTVEYRESLFVGYRYYDTARKPVLFPFGYGLSYTQFEYSDLVVSCLDEVDHFEVEISFKIKNVGEVAGKETAQIYVHDSKSSLFRPEKELKEFVKVELQPGEETIVDLALGRRALAFYDPEAAEWVLEAGIFEILVGASSQDIRLRETIRVESGQAQDQISQNKALVDYQYLTDSQSISREAFEALYGRPLPVNDPPKKGNYSLNTPIEDLQGSLFGRMLLKMMTNQITKMFGDVDEDDPMLVMVQNMVKEMPLRSIAMMSNGAITDETLNAMLYLVNGKFFKGISSLLGSKKKA